MRPVLAVLVLAGFAFAGESDVNALLASKTARDHAWGAHHAKDRAAIPRLRELLKLHVGNLPAAEAQYAAEAIADALVRLKAALPTDELAALPANLSGAYGALLAANPAQHTDLLLRTVRAPPRRATWLIAANALYAQKSETLTKILLERHAAQITVLVLTPRPQPKPGGRKGAGGVAVAGGFAPGKPTFVAAKGWPPRVRYTLIASKQEGATKLIDGPVPVWIRREVSGKEIPMLMLTGFSRHRNWELAFLAARAGLDPKKAGLAKHTLVRVPWTDAATLKVTVQQRRAELEQAFAKLVKALGQEPRPLKVTTKVHDLRRDKQDPLPDID